MTGELLRLALSLAVNPARIADAAAARAKRMMVVVVCAIAAGVVLLPAVGCVAAALWIFVQHRLGPVWAGVITAAAFILLAVFILIIGLIASRSPRNKRTRLAPQGRQGGVEPLAAMLPAVLGFLAARREAAKEKSKVAAAHLGARGRGFFANHKGSLLLGALVAGLVLGSGRLRKNRWND